MDVDKIAAIVAALTGPQTDDAGRTTWNPPPEYDYQYEGNLEIRQMRQDLIQQACDMLFANAMLDIGTTPTQKGCAVYDDSGNGTIIAIDEPYQGIYPEDVIRHEMGHLNGWSSEHGLE